MAMELSATRPATVFLCYRREDEEEVKYLQQQLEVRGMRTLRDVTDLHLGADVDKEITDMIEKRCDAFVIYITPGCLEADYVWEIEVPTACQ